MTTRFLALTVLTLAIALHAPVRTRAMPAQDDDQIRLLLGRIEQAARAGDAQAYLALVSTSADRKRAEDFAATEFRPGATRALLKERTRAPVADAPPDTAYRVILDALVEFGGRARIATWHFDIRRSRGPGLGGRQSGPALGRRQPLPARHHAGQAVRGRATSPYTPKTSTSRSLRDRSSRPTSPTAASPRWCSSAAA